MRHAIWEPTQLLQFSYFTIQGSSHTLARVALAAWSRGCTTPQGGAGWKCGSGECYGSGTETCEDIRLWLTQHGQQPAEDACVCPAVAQVGQMVPAVEVIVLAPSLLAIMDDTLGGALVKWPFY